MARFDVGYPINFYSGGDTTSQAIGKHIDEIKKIYGHLNMLDSEMLSGDEIKKIIGDITNNISFDKIKGSLDLSRTTGTLPFDRVSGNIPASRVVGELTNATINASKVTELISYLQNSGTFKTWLNSLISEAIKGSAGSDFPVGFIMPVTSLPITVPGSSSSKWESKLSAYLSTNYSSGAIYNQTNLYNVLYSQTLNGGAKIDNAEYIRGASDYAYNESNRRVEIQKDTLLNSSTLSVIMGSYEYTLDKTEAGESGDREYWSWKKKSNDGYIKRIS